MVTLPILSEQQMLWECAGLGPSSGKQISLWNPLVSMDCQTFLWIWPGPLKKSQVHARIQTHLPPLYSPSASDRTISTHTALTAITHSCHSLLSPYALEDWSQYQPPPMTWKGSISGVWHARVSDLYSVIIFFKITAEFSKPEDYHFWKNVSFNSSV